MSGSTTSAFTLQLTVEQKVSFCHPKMKRVQGLTLYLQQQVNIWFGIKSGWNFVQIKTALDLCYGQGKLSDAQIYHWINEFEGGHTRIVDLHRAPKAKSGRSRANIRTVENIVSDDRRVTIHRIVQQSGLNYGTVQNILKKNLKLSKKCAKYTPHLLTAIQAQRSPNLQFLVPSFPPFTKDP